MSWVNFSTQWDVFEKYNYFDSVLLLTSSERKTCGQIWPPCYALILFTLYSDRWNTFHTLLHTLWTHNDSNFWLNIIKWILGWLHQYSFQRGGIFQLPDLHHIKQHRTEPSIDCILRLECRWPTWEVKELHIKYRTILNHSFPTSTRAHLFNPCYRILIVRLIFIHIVKKRQILMEPQN